MCGFAGFLDPYGSLGPDAARRVVAGMAQQIRHRGPDGSGVWADEQGRVALAHRRLSILDLSQAGSQPMASATGRYIVAFNGEIYNHQEFRPQLRRDGYSFRGHSDTEVLLALIERDGVHEALRQIVGMFAFALWDRTSCQLVLARDRMGEKPLYWGLTTNGRGLLFGSELKALRSHPGFDDTIDRSALVKFFRHGWVPGPRSIYASTSKLQPGHFVVLTLDHFRNAVPSPYFSLQEVASSGHDRPLISDIDEATSRLEELLEASVSRQMLADVPVGAFLSGGIDSSTIACLMQKKSPRRVRTFCIGFSEKAYDEAPFAAAIARHLGTDHTEMYVSACDAERLVPSIAEVYDEPFADSSALPTLLLARLTKEHVTVALSGDGGDELFGGYTRYQLLERVRQIYRIPGRRALALATRGLANWTATHLRSPSKYRSALERLARHAGLFAHDVVDDFYHEYISTWRDPGRVVVGGTEVGGITPTGQGFLPGGTAIERAMLADCMQYLPDDILVKVDRAAMNASLEARVPFLDPDVVRFAWTLPLSLKYHRGIGKIVLRRLLSRHVPDRLFERPKVGFAVPMATWLRGSLRDWADELLSPENLAQGGYLNPEPIRQRWLEHLSGVADWHFSLWIALVWQSWVRGQSKPSRNDLS